MGDGVLFVLLLWGDSFVDGRSVAVKYFVDNKLLRHADSVFGCGCCVVGCVWCVRDLSPAVIHFKKLW